MHNKGKEVNKREAVPEKRRKHLKINENEKRTIIKSKRYLKKINYIILPIYSILHQLIYTKLQNYYYIQSILFIQKLLLLHLHYIYKILIYTSNYKTIINYTQSNYSNYIQNYEMSIKMKMKMILKMKCQKNKSENEEENKSNNYENTREYSKLLITLKLTKNTNLIKVRKTSKILNKKAAILIYIILTQELFHLE